MASAFTRTVIRQAWRTTGILTGEETLTKDFSIIPDFFNRHEQRILLATVLQKLDDQSSVHFRRRRRKLDSTHNLKNDDTVESLFLPDNCYEFQEVLCKK
jgi:hypothetical protein